MSQGPEDVFKFTPEELTNFIEQHISDHTLTGDEKDTEKPEHEGTKIKLYLLPDGHIDHVEITGENPPVFHDDTLDIGMTIAWPVTGTTIPLDQRTLFVVLNLATSLVKTMTEAIASSPCNVTPTCHHTHLQATAAYYMGLAQALRLIR